jgi:hypothetical protein
LSKLERFEAGDQTYCTIVKNANPLDPYCMVGMDSIEVIAVPDEKYYTKRDAGEMHPADTPK